MATTLVDITGTWAEIATGPALFIIKRYGRGTLYVANEEAEAGARAFSGSDEIGRQLSQGDAVSTYARATETGWQLAVTPEGGGRIPDVVVDIPVERQD